MSTKVLIVEDEQSLLELLDYNLKSEGFIVGQAANAEDAEIIAAEEAYDIIVIDWMLPSMSGLELCRRLRAKPQMCNVPIIMLTSRSEEADRIRGFETGVDDYVAKPFSVSELTARIRACLRRTAPSKVADVLRALDIELNRTAHRAIRGQRELRLGPTDFRLLEFFMENAGRVLSRSQILDGVWGSNGFVDERTVDVHIGRVRQALNRGRDADPIRTVRGAGYMFDAKVTI